MLATSLSASNLLALTSTYSLMSCYMSRFEPTLDYKPKDIGVKSSRFLSRMANLSSLLAMISLDGYEASKEDSDYKGSAYTYFIAAAAALVGTEVYEAKAGGRGKEWTQED